MPRVERHGPTLRISRQARRRRSPGLGGISDGRAAGIAAYCETDVVNTYLLFTRFQVLRGHLTQEAGRAELEVIREALRGRIGQPSEPLNGEHWGRFLEAWQPDH